MDQSNVPSITTSIGLYFKPLLIEHRSYLVLLKKLHCTPCASLVPCLYLSNEMIPQYGMFYIQINVSL
jgi:hypothetical protein